MWLSLTSGVAQNLYGVALRHFRSGTASLLVRRNTTSGFEDYFCHRNWNNLLSQAINVVMHCIKWWERCRKITISKKTLPVWRNVTSGFKKQVACIEPCLHTTSDHHLILFCHLKVNVYSFSFTRAPFRAPKICLKCVMEWRHFEASLSWFALTFFSFWGFQSILNSK